MKNNLSLPALAWVILAAICLVFLLVGLHKALIATNRDKKYQRKIITRTIVSLLIWTGLLLFLSYNNFFSDFSKLPPRAALPILFPLPFVLLIAFSRKATQLLQAIPPHWMLWMQSFRIIVELLLLNAFVRGDIPVQMTFEGRNIDIITGVLALPVGFIVARGKTYSTKVAVAFNIIGILLLVNILVIALLSMPTSIRYFMNEPANTLVARFPFILLPGVLVPIAYSLHIFSLRQLLTLHSPGRRQRRVKNIQVAA